MKYCLALLLFFFIIGIKSVSAQQIVDSTKTIHSVRKATILSAILPGAGQVYNHKIWKVPIVYAGLGFMAFLVKNNNADYKKYNSALIKRFDTDSTNEELTNISAENLRILSDNSQRNRDLCIAGAFLIYTLNIIDAHVDAHLFTFDLDDNISLEIHPSISPSFNSETIGFQSGVNLSLHF